MSIEMDPCTNCKPVEGGHECTNNCVPRRYKKPIGKKRGRRGYLDKDYSRIIQAMDHSDFTGECL